MQEHPEELRPYLWKWIAVLDSRIIASGETPMEVMRDVRIDGDRVPLLSHVWPDDVDPNTYFVG